jgi:hypothetical protein
MDKHLYDKFLRYPTAKEVWEAIGTTFYDGSDAAQVFDLNKRVNTIKQVSRSVEEYYNELQDLWLEIDFCRPNPMVCTIDIKKFNKFTQESRVYSFLSGLDDKLDNERGNILQMTLFPTLEQAFARVRKEATRQEIMNKGSDGESHVPVAMDSKGQKFVNKSRLKCIHCGQTRHTKEQYFLLVEYLEWFKDRRKGKNNWSGKCQVAMVQIDGGSRELNQPRGSNTVFTNNHVVGSQPNQWMETSNSSGAGSQIHAVGTNSLEPVISNSLEPTNQQGKGLHAVGTSIPGFFILETSGKHIYSKEEEWLLDTGATYYMTYTEIDLINSKLP